MSAASPRRRAALATLGLALAATALTLLVAELAARLLAAAPARPAPRTVDPEIAKLPVLSGVFELALPNVRGRQGDVLWRTNSAGFRGPEVSPWPAAGVFRIAVAGDSFAAGQGVPEEDAYAAQLERMLNGSGAAARFEVLNFGLGGLDIALVLSRATQLGAKFHPHLYVYGLTLNDIFPPNHPAERLWAEQNRAMQAEQSRAASSPSYLLRAVLPRLVSLEQVLFASPDSYFGSLTRAYRDPVQFTRIEHGLDGFQQLERETGACVHVLIHTDLANLRLVHPFEDAYARIERAARERGLTVTPTLRAFRWRDAARLRIGAYDGHPNAEGHRILAEALYRGLRELPPSCGFPAIP